MSCKSIEIKQKANPVSPTVLKWHQEIQKVVWSTKSRTEGSNLCNPCGNNWNCNTGQLPGGKIDSGPTPSKIVVHEHIGTGRATKGFLFGLGLCLPCSAVHLPHISIRLYPNFWYITNHRLQACPNVANRGLHKAQLALKLQITEHGEPSQNVLLLLLQRKGATTQFVTHSLQAVGCIGPTSGQATQIFHELQMSNPRHQPLQLHISAAS